MTKQLLTTSDFHAFAKDADSVPPDAMIISQTISEPQPGSTNRRIKFIFSDGTVDRAGDTINPDGWELGTFIKNPVALFGHDSSSVDSVIGKAVNVSKTGNRLTGEIEFATADINPRAETCYKMVKAGLLNAVSVGFLPLDYAFSVDKDRRGGLDFKRQELLEISIVPVPANANALVTARSMGIDVGPLTGWAEEILRVSDKILVPKGFLEATFRAAKTPKSVRSKYLNGVSSAAAQKAATADWKVGAARDLPIDDSNAAWDGASAAAGILSAAGFDGDNPDSSTARRGFLIYDAAAPALRGSYKLPFAKMVGGALKASTSGIRAAASRLPQTDAPSAVLDDARRVIDHYEQKAGAGDQGGDKMLDGRSDLTAIASLEWLLNRLADVDDAAEKQEDGENTLAETVAALGQILVDMPAEEVAELSANDGDGLMPMMLAARTPGQKALMRLAMIAQSKAGRVLSAANSALLEQAKACHQKSADSMDQCSTMMGSAMQEHAKAMEMHTEAARCVKAVLGGEQEPDADEVDGADVEPKPTDHVVAEAPEVTEKDDGAAADAERQRRNRARARALELSMPV